MTLFDAEKNLNRLWLWLRVRLAVIAPPLAEALADRPRGLSGPHVTSFAPLVGLSVGLLSPILWPGIRHVYSESLSFMMMVTSVAIVSRATGAMLLVGYGIGSLAWGRLGLVHGISQMPIQRIGSWLISLMLLAISAVMVPLLARQLADDVPATRAGTGTARLGLRALLFAVACGLLTYVWSQAMIVLIRPSFTWVHLSPTTQAIAPVQQRWGWLVGAAVAAALARAAVERTHPGELKSADTIHRMPARRQALPLQLGPGFRIAGVAAMTALLLAGTYTHWIDAVVAFVAIATLLAWPMKAVGPLLHRAAAIGSRFPLIVRFTISLLVGYAISYLALKLYPRTDSFRPILIGSLLTVAVFRVLMAGEPPENSMAPEG